MAFDVEQIPDEANLFRKIAPLHVPSPGIISSAAFDQERLSVNWEKYRSAESTADGDCLFVVSINAEFCRGLEQSVEHTPIEPEEEHGPNQAHSEVCGHKKKKIKRELRDHATVVWTKA